MLFSDVFKIQFTTGDDWFDPITNLDTKLFIDPLLVRDSPHPDFKSAKKKVTKFFEHAFLLAAKSEKSRTDLTYRILLNSMRFPEVEEICLGYASRSTKGAGSGSGYGKEIVHAIYDSIELGIENLYHFESLGIFNEGIGRDRISDITANIIKKELIDYTQKIVAKHDIPTQSFPIINYEFDYRKYRWIHKVLELPENPYTGKGIILTPKQFILDLPNVSSDSFLDFVWDRKNQEIRDQFNYSLKKDINKKQIIRIARARRDWLNEFEQHVVKNLILQGYDLQVDPKGVYIPAKESLKYAQSRVLSLFADDKKSFEKFVNVIIKEYTHFIENNNGYKLLWNNDGTNRTEEAAQIIFTCTAKHYCMANNIDLSRENNLGRGPVDFKFSQGYENRVSIEIKLAKNSKFWDGITLQLPKYMEVEDIKVGYFLVICFNNKDFEKVKSLQTVAEQVSKEIGRSIIPVIVDASKDKPSASKLPSKASSKSKSK